MTNERDWGPGNPVWEDIEDEKTICVRCGRPWSRHAITGELTCFVHGRPDGSACEREIWIRYAQ